MTNENAIAVLVTTLTKPEVEALSMDSPEDKAKLVELYAAELRGQVKRSPRRRR